MPKPLDPFWEYGELDPPVNRQHLSCKLCGKVMNGGVYWLKYHLAKIPRNEVEICPISSAKLVAKATKEIEEYAENKKYTEAKQKEMASRSKSRASTHTHRAMGVESSEIHSSHSIMPTTTSSYFMPRTTPSAEPSIKSMLKKKKKWTNLWVDAFYRVIFHSILPRTHSMCPCLRLLVLLVRGINPPLMRS
jgi:hypothetical protein